ncbi:MULTISPECIES: FtsX-like permease family protein [unclassified Methanoculleus]|uniref:ABC transporter permease n=1 Tax=unclassified Methanoculleus TaxID=2619537 RepID=UPI0025DD7713|nr:MULTISPECIES: FtsX-like permease family protein [unclassified Methanoculleus]MCK9317204.1 ABC transporter permease [Methanoculleus sp.]MDD2255065.1 ABC transporter permease [Methanoculleus sp.]MDD2786652.1 ABC transporter permease [Methanoculleus sp.]MDD3215456.1 ABC transporter permease [Methanoculleus sp.]MDD4315405.1 ABC transporter permease [Methanoculleus sp.]
MIVRDIIFQLSVRNVRLNLLRSLLAALGIVIGVIAIASIGMMGANMTLSVTEQLTDMANKLTVTGYAGEGDSMEGPVGGGPGPPPPGAGGSSTDEVLVTENQFKDIKRIAGKYGVVYFVYRDSDQIEVGSDTGRATIYGLDLEVIRQILTVKEGEYPESPSSVLVGPLLAERMGLRIGSRIDIGDPTEGPTTTVRVTGILEERGLSMDINTDVAIVGSENLFVDLFGGEGEYGQVNIAVNNVDDVATVKSKIEGALNKKKDEVTVQDSSRMVESITSTVSSMTTFVTAIAGISLLVAAVSIFNVMMMSVTERVREIGILRSIGTQRSEVLRMFIYEAVIIGIVGAAIGAVLSLIVGYAVVVGMVGTSDYFFTYGSLIHVPEAMLIGVAVCIMSGVYPAWRASNLNPIEALRAE